MPPRRINVSALLGLWLLSTAVFNAPSVQGAVPATQCLAGGWRLARVPDVTETGAQISLVGFNATDWIGAAVPGTALTSYQNAGLIPDPYFGTNMDVLNVSGYYDTYYWYRDVFFVPSDWSGQNISLNFDGINWKADVYVNGSHVASLNGPFAQGKSDVTARVAPGATNCVAVMLHWSNATPYDAPAFIGADSWDFMPDIAGREVGLYQNVWLSAAGPVRIVDPFITTTLPLPNTSPAALTLQVGLTNSSGSMVSGLLSGTINPEGISFLTNVAVSASSATNFTLSSSVFSQLTVTNPALWWPNGYGPQNLHDLQLTFQTGTATSDVQNVRFGIRQYSYDTNGHDLQLSCNGRRILCKGGNWGMADAMLKYTPAQLNTAVQLHQLMNFNMIRCWHGNSDLASFYDACDQYGIMIWDEFWLNGSSFGLVPANMAMFETNAVDKIKRLRNRACLAVWCGENEATPPAPLNTFLPQAITQLDGTRLYFQASNAGGIHGGGPYAFQGPEWYFQNAYGFTTEIGLPSVPAVESMAAMMPAASLWPLGDTNWLIHNWAADIGNKGLSQYTNAISTEYGAATGITNFCEQAQLLNLENYKAIFEAWNAQFFSAGATNPCSGVLVWMSQPAWPSLIWQTYDWYFDLGGAFFGCKKGCEPIHVQWDCVDNSIRIINATAQSLSNANVSIRIFNSPGLLAYETNLTGMTLAADSATNCFTLFNGITGLSSVCFIKLQLTDSGGNLLSDNFYWRGTTYLNYSALRSLSTVSPVCSASYATTNGSTTITATFTNGSSGVAFAARLILLNETTGLRVLPTLYSDNYFSLVPGDAKTVAITFTNSALSSGPLQLMLSGWNIPSQTVLALTVTPAAPTVSAPAVKPAGPVNQGTTVSLVCSNVTGTAPFSFQWQASPNGVVYTNVSGATSNALVLSGATINDTGYYQLVVTASGQSVTSSVAPLTVLGSPHGARLSIKFAADKDYNYDAINHGAGTGALNSKYWFNCYGVNGGSSGVTNVSLYTTNDLPLASRAALVYNWAGEFNYDNEQTSVPNNLALMDSFITVDNNTWYLSVTNLDAAFTNGYSVCLYYFGGAVGWGGQNYIRYYAGLTTNTAALGTKQWDLYTTTTNNDGHFTRDLTPSNLGSSGETPGANYLVFTSLAGGAFDLLITNGNYGGLNALEIVANPFATTSGLRASTTNLPYGAAVLFTNRVTPAPSDGEMVSFLDGPVVLGSAPMSGGVAALNPGSLAVGAHAITAVFAGDANYLACTSAVLSVTVQANPTLSEPFALPSTNVYAGASVTLVCSNYSGTPPYAFQWQASATASGCTNITGAITNSLQLPDVTANNSGFYQLTFTASGQSVTSSVVRLTVNSLPVIHVQHAGGSVVLSWTQGILLLATNLLGPWFTNSAASPFTLEPVYQQMFYRVLSP